MKPRLYQFPYSMFCISVMRALEAGGISYESIEIPSWDRTDVIKATGGAYYQVPVLQHGSSMIFESGDNTQDVARYIDKAFLDGKLFPPQHEGIQAVLNIYLENEVEAVTFKLNDARRIPLMTDLVGKVMLIRHKERKFGRGCVDQWAATETEILAQATHVLSPLEAMLEHSRYLFSDTSPVYADFLLHGMIANIVYDYLHTIPEGLPAITRHYHDIGKLRF